MEYDEGFAGFRDLVLTNGTSRSVFGRFQRDLSGSPKRWTAPDRAAIGRARMVLVDPCFGVDSRLAAEFCHQLGTPHVVIDCRHDDSLHRHAAVTVLSHEFLRAEYPRASADDLLPLYTSASHGLTVITRGSQAVLFARNGQPRQTRDVVSVSAKTTIGAGDAFRAGIAYGLMLGWGDDATIHFAMSVAAAVCSRGPVAACPPSLSDLRPSALAHE